MQTFKIINHILVFFNFNKKTNAQNHLSSIDLKRSAVAMQ